MTDRPPVRERSLLEVRWRQLRNPPPPVVRAVLANLLVALIGGAALIAVDMLLPAIDVTPLAVLFVAGVVIAGSLLTYLWVELPTGTAGVRRRSPWAAVLGLFAAVPIAYLVLVLVFQVVAPILGRG